MPRFASDESVLLLSGATLGLFALELTANTRHAHDLFYVKQVGRALLHRQGLGLGLGSGERRAAAGGGRRPAAHSIAAASLSSAGRRHRQQGARGHGALVRPQSRHAVSQLPGGWAVARLQGESRSSVAAAAGLLLSKAAAQPARHVSCGGDTVCLPISRCPPCCCSQDAKKRLLKVSAAGWLLAGGMHCYNASAAGGRVQRTDVAAANAAVCGALAALCAWRGFSAA